VSALGFTICKVSELLRSMGDSAPVLSTRTGAATVALKDEDVSGS